jgi:hypothetical protein
VTLRLQLLVHPGPVVNFARRVSIATSTHVAASHLCCIYTCSRISSVLIGRYVEQDDIHSPQTTVREALSFSGHLRLPKDQSKRDVEAFVDQVRASHSSITLLSKTEHVSRTSSVAVNGAVACNLCSS